MELIHGMEPGPCFVYVLWRIACENSRPSSLPARVAFKRHSGRERRRTAVFAGYLEGNRFVTTSIGLFTWTVFAPILRPCDDNLDYHSSNQVFK